MTHKHKTHTHTHANSRKYGVFAIIVAFLQQLLVNWRAKVSVWGAGGAEICCSRACEAHWGHTSALTLLWQFKGWVILMRACNLNGAEAHTQTIIRSHIHTCTHACIREIDSAWTHVCACDSKRLTTLLAARTTWRVASFSRYVTMTVTSTLNVMWRDGTHQYVYGYWRNNDITLSFLFICSWSLRSGIIRSITINFNNLFGTNYFS